MERVQKRHRAFSIARWAGSLFDGLHLGPPKVETLDEKIKMFRKALKGTSRHSRNRIIYLKALSATFEFRHRDTRQFEDLEQWIQYSQDQFDVSNGMERRDAMVNLARALLARYDALGQILDLDRSIQYGEKILLDASDQSPGSLNFLYIHSHALRRRYMCQHQSSDLDRAILYGQQVLDAQPTDSRDIAPYVANLSRCFAHQFDKTRDECYLENSIRLAQQAVDVTPLEHTQRADYLRDLGFQLGCRYDQSGSTTDLERSLQLQLQAVEDVSKNGRVTPEFLYSLAVAFKRRYDRYLAGDDLEKYIQYTQQAVNSAYSGSPNMHVYVKHLAVAYRKLYERNKRSADLEKTIEINQKSLTLFPAGHSARPQFLASLCRCLMLRAEKCDQPDDIFQAICYAKEAVDSVPGDNLQRPRFLITLSSAHLAVFYNSHENSHLDQAIEHLQAALSCSREGDPMRGRCYLFLGEALNCRAGVFNQQSDSEQAIGCLQEALNCLSVHEGNRVSALCALGDAYSSRYHLSPRADKVLLDKAVHHYQLALSCISDKDKRWPGTSINLSRILVTLFTISRKNCDIDSAIKHCEDALATTKTNERLLRFRCFANFGHIFSSKFEKSDQIVDLQQSLHWYRQALELGEPDIDEMGRLTILDGMGTNYRRLYEHTKSADDLKMSDESMEEVFRKSKFVMFRLYSGSSIVALAALSGLWSRAAKYLDEIIPLLPDIIPPSRTRDDSQHILRHLYDIAPIAATVYLNVGRSPLEALEALESFRGIIANVQVDAKSDVSMLKDHHPHLWNEYTKCRDELSLFSLIEMRSLDSGSSVEELASYNAAGARRQQLFQKLQDLHAEIRNCAGFEKFLLPPRGKDITALADEGPLVCLNINNYMSHAFLVTTDGVDAIPLPGCAEDRIRSSLSVFNYRVFPQHRDVEIVESDGDDDDELGAHTSDKMAKELGHWWFIVVKPVLEKLGLLRETRCEGRLPRIWWVGGGIMSLVPLHAAGVYATNSMENALSHVVSSYVPTVKILQSLRRRPPISIASEARRLVVVSMPTTPGTYSMLNTEEEAGAIAKHSRSAADVTILTRPTKDEVIKALKSSVLAHFACHGSFNFALPGKSALILGRDTMERLTVDEILDTITHSGAEIAYLSACSTAEMQAGKLIHESIHLASAFQLAGFKSVIGTLWRADDKTAVAIASKFYELLFREREISSRSVAYALHEAVMQYQQNMVVQGSPQISTWVPFIHFGC